MYKIIVWALLIKKDKILLLKKPDNGEWTSVGGHVEDHESLKMAVCREAMEELGIKIQEENLSLLCVIDRKLDDAYKFHVFFHASQWEGDPVNKEPDVHTDVEWYKLSNLPDNLGPLASAAIDSLDTKQLYYFRDHQEEREV
ncbi:MAG: NUDIX domain-containing protein [Janthinobacterium lividum]